ncbi:MAG: hypothetical protein F6K41_03800, partial [Symploca sp. SIO3E6]|nr:hypothetical protein [Caldora sp. SIO3E6]
ETDVTILTPYYKIKRSELSAISALGLAGVIDGLGIWLGTAIIIQQRTSLLENLRKLKKFLAAFTNEYKKTATPDLMKEDTKTLARPLDIVTNLGAPPSLFLLIFYRTIDKSTGKIDYELLKKDDKAIVFYEILLESMRKVGWVKIKKGNWYVELEHYNQCTEWLNKEIDRLIRLETKNGDPGNPYNPLTIDIPSSSPQQSNKNKGLPGKNPGLPGGSP